MEPFLKKKFSRELKAQRSLRSKVKVQWQKQKNVHTHACGTLVYKFSCSIVVHRCYISFWNRKGTQHVSSTLNVPDQFSQKNVNYLQCTVCVMTSCFISNECSCRCALLVPKYHCFNRKSANSSGKSILFY